MTGEVKIGFAREEMKIPLPVMQGGYSDRTQPASGVHDPLTAGCLFLSSPARQVAVVSLDLLAAYNGYGERIRRGIADGLGGEVEVVCSCIHTHAAPSVQEKYDLGREALVEAVVQTAVQAARAARQEAAPAHVRFAQRPFDRVGSNRDAEDAAAPVVLKTAAVRAGEKTFLAVNYNCHPTVLSAGNRLLSRDYVGAALDRVGERMPVVFLQGACGDISTRFRRRGQDFAEAERLGGLLAEAALALAGEAAPEEAVERLDYREFPVELPLKEYRDAAYYEAEIRCRRAAAEEPTSPGEHRIRWTAYQGVCKEYESARNRPEIPSPIRCELLTLNRHAFLFTPFELYSALGRAIADGSPFETTWLVGYTGDCLGYLPDRAGFDSAGYEAMSSAFAPGAGERFVEQVLAALAQADSSQLLQA